jgi:PadR family transcriptional regulator, regulatory protein PadR
MEQEKKSKSTVSQGMRDAMKKATTEMLVLFMLRQKPMYTYQIAQEVNRLTQGVLSYNTMYLAVYRLQENGFIEEAKKSIEDGRARIYLGITLWVLELRAMPFVSDKVTTTVTPSPKSSV